MENPSTPKKIKKRLASPEPWMCPNKINSNYTSPEILMHTELEESIFRILDKSSYNVHEEDKNHKIKRDEKQLPIFSKKARK